MDCDVFRSSITDYLDRALSSSVTQSMDEHRLECDRCETFLCQMRLTIDALGGLSKGKKVEPMPSSLLSAFRHWAATTAEYGELLPEYKVTDLLEFSEDEVEEELVNISPERLERMAGFASEEALRMGVREPQEAVRFARLGVRVSEWLYGITENSNLSNATDRLAYSWAVFGNVCRICSDFQGARDAFKVAEDLLAREDGEALRRAEILQLKSSFLADRGQVAEALECIDVAIRVFGSEGEDHHVGKALITKGTLMGPYGDSELAAETLRRGLEMIDRGREPRLVLVARHNLIHSLFECGKRDEALAILGETRSSHLELNNPVDLVRFQWLEGKIALDLEDLGGAEECFIEAKSYFVEQGMAYDAALVSLDLAMVYLKQTRIPELKNLAAEMVTIFRGLGIRREVLAALAFFNKALEIEQTATVGLLQELIETLERTRQREECRPQLGVSN